MSTDDTNAARRGSGSNDLLGLVERLRFLASGQDDQHSVALTEAADEIDRLRSANEALLRWKSTNAPRLEALKGLLHAAQHEAHAGREAIASLSSERAANSTLTEELERLAAGPWQPMRTAPKDGLAVLALVDGSDIPRAVRWLRGPDDPRATEMTAGAGWHLTWDGTPVPEHDGPRYWMHCPDDPDDCEPEDAERSS